MNTHPGPLDDAVVSSPPRDVRVTDDETGAIAHQHVYCVDDLRRKIARSNKCEC